MSSQSLSIGRQHGVRLSRLLWPMGLLFAATLWIVFSTILWTSDTVNEIAVDRERAQISAALDQHLGTLRSRILDFLLTPDLLRGMASAADSSDRSRFDQQALSIRDFDSVILISPDWTLLGGMFDAAPAHGGAVFRMRRLMESAVQAALAPPSAAEDRPDAAPLWTTRHHVEARWLHDGQEIYAALAVPVELPASPGAKASRIAVVAAQKYLDTAALRNIAAFHDLTHLAIASRPGPDAAASLPVLSPKGDIAAYLVWEPSRPGDLMRQRLVPLCLFGFGVAVVLFGLVAAYIRWLARDLVATDARSRNLIGRDPLSGLANRLLFAERLDRDLAELSRGRTGVAVLFIDLDRFKDVNDTYGHQAGDDLIQLVGRRLRGLVRADDTIARFGGDEFAIIQTAVTSPDDAEGLARRILTALAEPFALAHSQVIIGASIGIALAPAHGTNREVLMGLADTALYQAKGAGRNRFVFFEARMDETIRMRRMVEEDLRQAIDEHQLVLHYQPLYASDGETIVGLEALVRWPHPTRGLIPPAEFIPIAEERGLVIPLGDWVLRRACEDGKRWPGIRIAVNVSPIQFRQRDFVPNVVRLLEETGFDPALLELELTEGVVVEDADAAESAMMELRALGVHLALDDFGTGYSSLIYLRRFAFDTIKIDRSFLESMEATGESAILVHSMVHLGRALGLTVTAEGVETTEQHRFLQALGCHQLQGYLFSRPIPAAAIDLLLASKAAATAEAA